ncbi:MAG: hypothetical protein CL583_06140 [Alteromonadaceae bacterium]|nr:hypothetical protein [Alteromonadaceae bacterium]
MSFECRMGCGACCIAPSISSPIPGMPAGKPAGVRCVHLDEENLCELFGSPDRPAVCAEFTAEPGACGSSRTEALTILRIMEQQTSSDV